MVEVMKGLTHLNAHQKAELLQVLQENKKMFDRTLGVYPHKKVHIDIDPNAKPVHSRPYPVPQIHLKTYKKELNHLVRIGVLTSQQESEWVLPSFIIPKKDSRVRWISNLRQLNKVIRHKQYPLPTITDILLRSLRYIYSNPFSFLISSLGSPIFLLRIAERERWKNMPPTTTH
jgi:hypothetical protein